MTNQIVQVVTQLQSCQAPLWGTGSEWFFALIQCVIVGLTLGAITWGVWVQTKQVKLQSEQSNIQTEQSKIQTEQIKMQTATHVVQTIFAIQDRWNAPKMQQKRNLVCKMFQNSPKADFNGDCEYIAEFFEDIATFIKVNAISKDIIWDTTSWYIECYFPLFKDGIMKMRDKYKDDLTYDGLVNLFADMVAISKSKGCSIKGEQDIKDFLIREIESTGS